MLNSVCVVSPFGSLSVFEGNGKVISLEWGDNTQGILSNVLIEARKQLTAYFNGELRIFDLPLNITGSDFQRAASQMMLQIPYGKTATYGELAKKLNTSARPLGGACGRNTIPIIIPCHRVMGANRKMTGFSGLGGIKTKEALLRHEGWVPSTLNFFK